jgi:uncharacterized delta-60 repeat protein
VPIRSARLRKSRNRSASCIESLEGRTLMSATAATMSPDEAFGLGGKVLVDVFGRSEQAKAVVVQSDGKIVVGGMAMTHDGSRNANGVLVRLNPDGSLDDTFGNHGVVVADPFDYVNAVLVTADGHLLVGGDRWGGFGAGSNSTVARYNADGSLDTTFGTGGSGFTRIDAGTGWDSFSRLAIAPDGKIVGLTIANFESGGDQGDFGVVRFNNDGTIDTRFGGGDGVVTTDFSDEPSIDLPYSVTFAPGGRLVVGGRTMDYGGTNLTPRDGGFAIARYNDDGSLDATFGDGGRVITRFAMPSGAGGWVTWGSGEADELVASPDGKLLAIGTSSMGGLTLARYNADGSLDASFGTGGLRYHDTGVLTYNGWHGAQRLGDGSVAVFTTGVNAVAAGVVTADGELTNFQTAPFAYNKDTATAAAFQPDGKLVVVGFSAPQPMSYTDTLGWWETTDLTAWRFSTDVTGFQQPALPEPDPAPEPEPLPDPAPDYTADVEPDSIIETSVQGKNLVRSGRYYTFKAVYRCDESIEPSSLGGMAVAGPNGYAEAADVTKARSSRHGRVVTVTYRVTAPGGSFDAADNGTYSIVRTDADTMPRSAALFAAGAGDAGPSVSGGEGSPVGTFEVNARARSNVSAAAARWASVNGVDDQTAPPGDAADLLGMSK